MKMVSCGELILIVDSRWYPVILKLFFFETVIHQHSLLDTWLNVSDNYILHYGTHLALRNTGTSKANVQWSV